MKRLLLVLVLTGLAWGQPASSNAKKLAGKPPCSTTVTTNCWMMTSVGGSIITNAEYDGGTCTTAFTVAPANGNRQKITLTNAQTCALTFTQPSSGTVTIQLTITQSASGSYNGAISGGLWSGGVTPTITQATGAVDVVTCFLNGTNAKCVWTPDFR